MDSDTGPAPPPPWEHRSWCAPDCSFPPGRVEDSEQVIGGRLADITSSAGLSTDEAGRVFEQLVAFARRAREVGGGDRGTSQT